MKWLIVICGTILVFLGVAFSSIFGTSRYSEEYSYADGSVARLDIEETGDHRKVYYIYTVYRRDPGSREFRLVGGGVDRNRRTLKKPDFKLSGDVEYLITPNRFQGHCFSARVLGGDWQSFQLCDGEAFSQITTMFREHWAGRVEELNLPSRKIVVSVHEYATGIEKRERGRVEILFAYDFRSVSEIRRLPSGPNQALEPTTPAVTIPAAQEVAPAGIVAHL